MGRVVLQMGGECSQSGIIDRTKTNKRKGKQWTREGWVGPRVFRIHHTAPPTMSFAQGGPETLACHNNHRGCCLELSALDEGGCFSVSNRPPTRLRSANNRQEPFAKK